MGERYNLKHGMSESVEFRTWKGMRQRCTPGNNAYRKDFANYGGRGITVCDRWADFESFFADMGPRPTPGHSIDRIDNDGNYEPSNCRWATRVEQRKNSRGAMSLEYGGLVLTLKELSITTKINRRTLARRLGEGMSVDDAVAMPVLTKAQAGGRSRGGWGGARVSRGLKHARRAI